MEDVGDTGLARCWAEGPAVGCAAHAALASTTTRAAAAMAPRMCLSPLSPREPVTNRLRVCCSGARAGIIMPLPGAGVRHAWSLSPGLPQTRRWTVAGSLRNQRSLPPTGGSGQGEPRLHRRGDAAGPLDRTPHAAAPPTTQSTTDEVLRRVRKRSWEGLGSCMSVRRAGGPSRVTARRGPRLCLGTGGGGGPWWLDDQLHRAAVALVADHGTAVQPDRGERAEDVAAGVHPEQLHPPVGEPVGVQLCGDDPVGGGRVDAGAVLKFQPLRDCLLHRVEPAQAVEFAGCGFAQADPVAGGGVLAGQDRQRTGGVDAGDQLWCGPGLAHAATGPDLLTARDRVQALE